MIEQAAKKKRKHLHELLTWKVVLIASAILLAIFGVGCAFDCQISEVVHVKSGAYKPSLIMYAYLMIGFVVLAFSICWAFVISSFSYKKDKIWVPILGSIFGWGCMFMFGFYMYAQLEPFQEIYGEKAGMIHNIVLLVVILVGSFIFAMALFGDKLNQSMCKRTFTYLLEVVIIVALVVFFKCLWSRPTPWNVFDETIKYDFRPWWSLDPFMCFKQKAQSPIYLWTTPAGFASQSAVIIFATQSTLELTNRYDKNKLHTFFFYVGFSYVLILSVLRLLAGESFLSDIALSVACGLCLSYGSKHLAKQIRVKKYGEK